MERLAIEGWKGSEMEGYRRTLIGFGGNPVPGMETVQTLTLEGDQWLLLEEGPKDIDLIDNSTDTSDPESMRVETTAHYRTLKEALDDAERWRGRQTVSPNPL